MSFLRGIFGPVENAGARELPRTLRTGPLDRFDRWALGIILLVFVVMAANFHGLGPSMSDTWYHLNIGKGIMEKGWIDGWDEWHYAPFGRPHLYPPVLHLLLAALGWVTGSILTAGKVCAVVFLPASMVTIWYLARRVLGSRLALLAVLLALTDLFHFVIMQAYITGCLVNILLPLLLVTFLSRRPWWSILLLTLIYYSHLGFSHCAAAGLLLFGLKYRSYLRLSLKVVAISFLFFSPWLAHVVGHLDWLPVLAKGGMPGSPLEKLLCLQNFNVVLLVVGIWGIAAAPRRDPARRLPIYILIGFLPILFAYGGRYPMHTLPMWCVLGASVLGGLLPAAATARRIIGIAGLTFLPLPTLGLFGALPITASHMLVIMSVTGRGALGNGERNEAYKPDCDMVAGWLKKHTDPGDVVHVNTVWVAEMVSLLADRRTDHGAWWECSKESAKLYGRMMRDASSHATFVYVRPEADPGSVIEEHPEMPGVDRKFTVGRFEIGVREPPGLEPAEAPVGNWRALKTAGAAGDVEHSQKLTRWTFPARGNKLAHISAPLPEGTFAGVRLNLRSSRMDDRLVFGIKTRDGGYYSWPLSIPEANMICSARVVFKWMVNSDRECWSGQPVDRICISRPPGKPVKRKRDEEIEQQTVEICSVGLLAEQ